MLPLTPAQVQAHNVALDLGADEVQTLIDAASVAIDAVAGPLGEAITDHRDGGFSYLFLRRQATAISTVTETLGSTVTTLAAGDYELRDDGVSLRRLDSGSNPPLVTFPSARWVGRVAITYEPVDDTAERIRVALELIALDAPGGAALSAGVLQEQTGSHSIQFAQGTETNVQAARASILGTLLTPVTGPPGFA